jgi:hypothetical protein
MAKPQWKRVLVTLPSGDKAYRYTDGKGNYRLSHPDSSESMASRRGLSSSQGGPSIGEQLRIMAGPAGGETRTARVKGKPTAGESKPAPPAAKPKPKPRGMANIPPKEANAPVNVQARKPKPAPAASTTSKPKPKPAAPAAAKPKPKPKPKPEIVNGKTVKRVGPVNTPADKPKMNKLKIEKATASTEKAYLKYLQEQAKKKSLEQAKKNRERGNRPRGPRG